MLKGLIVRMTHMLSQMFAIQDVFTVKCDECNTMTSSWPNRLLKKRPQKDTATKHEGIRDVSIHFGAFKRRKKKTFSKAILMRAQLPIFRLSRS